MCDGWGLTGTRCLYANCLEKHKTSDCNNLQNKKIKWFKFMFGVFIQDVDAKTATHNDEMIDICI